MPPLRPWARFAVSAAVAVASGLLYGLLARWAFEAGGSPGDALGGVMTLSFLTLVPLAVGYLTVHLAPEGVVRRRRWSVLLPWVTALLSLGATMALGWEGAICVVMMFPVFLLFASAGGILARDARRTIRRGPLRASALGAALLLPYMVAPAEGMLPYAERHRTVENRIEIAADPAEVWAQIVRVPEIHPEEYRRGWIHRIGFPEPVEATLSREGVGGVRMASFRRGVVFRETVTEWEPERRLRFSIDPHVIPAGGLDEHVTVGGPYFDVLEGTYRIEPAGPGRTVLRLSSTHRLSTRFDLYASLWTDGVMSGIQRGILEVVRDRAEAARRARRREPGGADGGTTRRAADRSSVTVRGGTPNRET